MNCAVLLISAILLAACARQTPPAPVAAQSACPETLPDVDRVACMVSARPQPPPAGGKPAPVLLRGTDGTPIIGPKPSQ